ncbi:MAG: Asp-tRNA(Asn)/Glu-tRNA(Gln) amidotransferase subunit GatB [Nanoarchaeota archaeon]
MKELDNAKIGLEIHIQLKTSSKLFCGCSTKSGKPNTEVCEICLGMPGSKPVVNRKAVEFAVKLGLALNCTIQKENFFSRKVYGYPDMSKNFQITQYEFPLCANGNVRFKNKVIRIRRIHIEEDPASIQYPKTISDSDYCLIDYNRAGVPLCEIVTEPDLTSAEEAKEFLEYLISIIDYLDIYDSKNFTIRVDANVSLPGTKRAEIKNITGFRAVEKAIGFEIIRQKGKLRRNEEFKQETMHFDAISNKVIPLREKEFEEDYGYIFDPDLPKLLIEENLIKKIKNEIPELPGEKIKRLIKEYNLSEDIASVLVSEKEICDLFEESIKKAEKELVIRLTTGILKKVLNYNGIKLRESKLTKENFIELLKLIEKNELTVRMADLLLRKLIFSKKNTRELVKELKFTKINDMDKIVEKVLGKNKEAVEDYKKGNSKALHFLIGQVLKEAKEKADAKLIERKILEKI